MWTLKASDKPPPSMSQSPDSFTSHPSDKPTAAQLLEPLPIVKKSRNDLFSLDWSNLTPHVASSRSSTPTIPNVVVSSKPKLVVPATDLLTPVSPKRFGDLSSSELDCNQTISRLNNSSNRPSIASTTFQEDLTGVRRLDGKAPPLKVGATSSRIRDSDLVVNEERANTAGISEFGLQSLQDIVENEFNDSQIGELQHFTTTAVPEDDSINIPLFTSSTIKSSAIMFPETPPASIASSSLSSTNSSHVPSSAAATGPGISDNPILDSRQAPRLRLAPIPDYSLGEGRHATVYLGSFVPRELANVDPPAWTLCAVKRIFPDRDSQIAGLGEAFILSKLALPSMQASSNSVAARGSSRILRLFGVRDERDGVEVVEHDLPADRRRKAYEEATLSGSPGGSTSNVGSLGLGRAPSMQSTVSEHQIRATSDSVYLPLPSSGRPHPRSLRRQTSFTSPTLSPPIGSPTLALRPELFPETPVESTASSPKSGWRRRKNSRHSEPPQARSVGAESPPTVILDTATPPTAEPRRRTVTSERVASDTSGITEASEVTAKAANNRPPTPRIMLLLEYCSLGHALGFARAFPERMGRKRWVAWARDLVAAVAWAHERGVLHADIKPQNVLITSDLSIRLADFGMAMFLPSSASSHPPPTDPLGLGTPPYAPPEFVRPPPSPFGRPADIFSLGVTLNVLITGVEPYANMRSVERMLWVGRGGYWEWEQRRRERGSSTGTEAGSADVSRQGSIRSVQSGRRSRADSGTSLSLLSSSGGGVNGAFFSSPIRGPGAGLRRSESVESERSVHSVASIGGRNRWNLAMLAKKLLSPHDLTGQSTHVSPASSTPATPGSPAQPPWTPTRSSKVNDTFISPSFSRSSDDDEDRLASSSHSGHGHHDGSLDDDEDPTVSYSAPALYPDGYPQQYFLDGHDVVSFEVRSLLRAMTSPKEADRPTAKEVLRILDLIEI